LPKVLLPLSVFWKSWQLMREHRYDVIHAYQASQAAAGAWLLTFLYPTVPFLLTMQEGKRLHRQGRLIRWVRRMILWRVNFVTVISRYLKDYVRYVNPRLPVEIIPNAVDVAAFSA